MAPKGKSSASSNTRKKHAAKKAAADGEEPQQPPQRGQKKPKVSRFAPKVKTYTPPPPPPKGAPDPVDVYLYGGAGIDPELVVILRLLGKKDEASLTRGVEGLDAAVRTLEAFLESGTDEEAKAEAEIKVEEMERCMDVWAHHLPRLILHPSRRLRLLTLTLHSLLTLPSPSLLFTTTRAALLTPHWTEQSSYVGSWCSSAFDADRACRNLGQKSWDASGLETSPSAMLPTSTISAEVPETIEDEEQSNGVWDFAMGLALAPPITTSSGEPDDPSLLQAQGLLTLAHIVSLPNSKADLASLANPQIWDLVKLDSPLALRRAGYELLGVVSGREERWTPEEVESVAEKVLAFVWGQGEGWAGVVAFLRKYPEAWTMANSALAEDHDNDDDDQDDDTSGAEVSTSVFTPSPIMSHLFLHLQTSCSGTPSMYPTILLLLSTIPVDLLPPTLPALNSLFEAFFSVPPSAEWASAALESILWEAARMEDDVGRKNVLKSWIGRLWVFVVKGKVGRALNAQLEAALGRLSARDQELFRAPWSSIRELAISPGSLTPPLAQALKVFAASESATVKEEGSQLSVECALLAIEREELDFYEGVKPIVEGNEDIVEATTSLSLTKLSTLLRSTTTHPEALTFLLSQLGSSHLPAPTKSLIWESLFQPSPIDARTLSSLIHQVKSGAIATEGLANAGVDDVVLAMGRRVLDGTGSEAEEGVVVALIASPSPFVSESAAKAMHDSATSLLISRADLALLNPSSDAVAHLLAPIRVLKLSQAELTKEGVVAMFEAAVLLGVREAEGVWEPAASTTSQDILVKLRRMLLDDSVLASPIDLVNATVVLLKSSSTSGNHILDLLPSPDTISSLAASLLSPPPASLSILSPLVSQSALITHRTPQASNTFPRVILALLDIAGRDTRWARQALWSLPHLLLFIDVARDENALPRGVFSNVVEQELVAAAEGLASYLLSSVGNELSGSDLTSAIVLAVKAELTESPRFQRYQNELASVVAGISPSAASTRGLPVLRILLVSAPPLDSPTIFLPQQRTMFLIQKIQSWIASEDDLDEEIHSAVAELFLHLAPIVQDLSGSHWDLVFDVIESNLETASWEEDATLPALYHSTRLLALMKDLAASNAELRATVRSRIDASLKLVRDLFVSRPESGSHNEPRAMVLEVMAGLIRDLPLSLLSMGIPFDQLLHLLKDPSLSVQQSAYDLVSRIASKHVSDLVVELELGGETSTNAVIELPSALIALVSAKLDLDVIESPDLYSVASTYLLAWLTVFKFFDHASPRIKAGYIDQLRRLDLVPASFIPSVFGLLHLSDRTRVFDVTPWAVDEYAIELMDDVSPITLPVLATYVYYRSLQALPSLIRSWWEACKNRQLSMAVASFTSKHFSPVLIAHELAHLRDPEDPAGKALRDNEDFTVKVAAGANEVKAVFVVDEQNMEIGIRLPNEFPLQGVEVKDVRKVGVTDAQWRAWLLAVQQVITTQNGLIADALGLFKRNVTLHFEGVEACAICYSVISVVDRSLPTKSCRTCNNRFHAGCLFKWFSTSHGSSCPLCRSLF